MTQAAKSLAAVLLSVLISVCTFFSLQTSAVLKKKLLAQLWAPCFFFKSPHPHRIAWEMADFLQLKISDVDKTWDKATPDWPNWSTIEAMKRPSRFLCWIQLGEGNGLSSLQEWGELNFMGIYRSKDTVVGDTKSFSSTKPLNRHHEGCSLDGPPDSGTLGLLLCLG